MDGGGPLKVALNTTGPKASKAKEYRHPNNSNNGNKEAGHKDVSELASELLEEDRRALHENLQAKRKAQKASTSGLKSS